MRASPAARLIAGVVAIALTIALVFLLSKDHAEAPDRIDFFADVDPSACDTGGGTAPGPYLCLTDAPPTPTADTRDQRAALLANRRLATIVEAAESADVDALIDLAVKVDLCEIRMRQMPPECADGGYVDAVQQSLFKRPVRRHAELMREWLTNLLAAGSSRLDLAVRSIPTSRLPADYYVLVFKLPGRANLGSPGNEYDHLVLHVSLNDPQPIEQFNFLAWPGNPSEFLLEWLDPGAVNFRLVLGQCHPEDRFHCD